MGPASFNLLYTPAKNLLTGSTTALKGDALNLKIMYEDPLLVNAEFMNKSLDSGSCLNHGRKNAAGSVLSACFVDCFSSHGWHGRHHDQIFCLDNREHPIDIVSQAGPELQRRLKSRNTLKFSVFSLRSNLCGLTRYPDCGKQYKLKKLIMGMSKLMDRYGGKHPDSIPG
jgi:hypothetical protein